MNDDDSGFFPRPSLSQCKVAVLGLGLMGGSLALALRGRCQKILGYDPDPQAVALAREYRAVDLAAEDSRTVLAGADLVILAAPVRAIIHLLADLPGLHPGRAVVIDLGSTKQEIVEAMACLPERFDPLGGHPMCGREKGTLAAADKDLFLNRTFAFTALKRTSTHARRLAEELALAVGAHALWLDVETHDRWTSASSHLPYLVANALAAATPGEAAPMIGTGFISTTRLAISPVEMMLDVVLTNRPNLIQALHSFRGQLDQIEHCLAEGDEAALRELLREGAAQRERLVPTPR
jgi:prephenate dehydrogenase